MNRPAAYPVVPVTLDLRGFHTPPRSLQECVALWKRLEPELVTVDPLAGPRVRFDLGEEGEVGVWFLAPAAARLPLGPGTPFAIHGVLESAVVRNTCATCRTSGSTTYAPYRCPGCDEGRRVGRVCEAHAVFLDGSLRASCVRHAPVCRCGTAAVAWCSGVRCRSRTAWCETHLCRHPGDASVAYCADCYAERFPECEVQQCSDTGYICCEHRTLAAMKPCGRRVCADHVRRWQVYGRFSRGVALCSRHHRGLGSTSAEDLIDIVLAGTVARANGKRWKSASNRRVQLPRISIIRHILINTRGAVLDMEDIDRLFTSLERRLRGLPSRDVTVSSALDLLARHRTSRREDIERFRQQHVEGHAYFNRMIDALRRAGRWQLADAVEFSDFRPGSGILFVKVPEHLVGLFKGKRRANIQQLEQQVGVSIQVERRG